MATVQKFIGAHGLSLAAGGNITFSFTDAITAHAGGGQASAVQLTTQINNVTVVGTGADSVKMPTPATSSAFPDGPVDNLGAFIVVINSGANTLAVFPDTGGTINGAAANASVNVAAGEVAIFLQTSALTWFSDTATAQIVTNFILNGATSGSTTVQAAAVASGTLTLPAATDTLVGKATTDTLTNKTLTSPVLTTPTLGVATATSINKTAITAPATSSTLAVADGKTFTANSSLTLAGTDSTTITFQGTDTYVGRATTDTLTNKTLTAPTISGVINQDTKVTTGATTANATITYASVTGLLWTVVPGTYQFDLELPSTVANGAGGIKYAFHYAAAVLTSIEATGIGYTASAVAAQHTTTATDIADLFSQAAVVLYTRIVGTMVVGTGGTVQLQMAQNTSNGSNSVSLLGASGKFTRLS